jgi:hypothetical protein
MTLRTASVVAGFALAGAVAGALVTGCDADEPAVGVCESTRDYFALRAWPVLQQKCSQCHNPQGPAKETQYVLQSPAVGGFLDHNLAVVSELASFERDGQSLLLLKPTRQIDHGGGQVIEPGSEPYNTLLGLVVRLKEDQVCSPRLDASFTGVELLGAADTLRKATLLLAGRLPAASELERMEEGGLVALDAVLDEVMSEEAFYDFVKRIYGDLFLTDFYLFDASDQLGEAYADPTWFETAPKELLAQYGLADASELARYTNIAIAREPLELIAHVVRQGRPFTEVVTADYFMVSPLSARSYGVTDAKFERAGDPFEFVEARLAETPHAGVLTSPMLLSRHPTTPTNRNRHRARMIYQWFLATDILRTAEQPVDQTKVTSLNPTRDDPSCTVCHAAIDPVAGTFQAFDETGLFSAEPEWFGEMFPPGFGKEQLPLSLAAQGLPWLGDAVAKDARFSLAVVQNVFRALTGQEPLVAPTDFADPGYAPAFEAFLTQANTYRAIADKLVASGYDFKVAVKELVLSPYFRARNSVPLAADAAGRLGAVGTAHLLTPEQLHDKIEATLGIPWLDGAGQPVLAARPRNPGVLGLYQLFYGGVDANNVVTRITSPNGVMAAVVDRMAAQMACRAVPQDFARAPEARLLFPLAEVEGALHDPRALDPETEAGIEIAPAIAGIKKTIAHLHARVLGERLAPTDVEIEATYRLFLETWREGRAAMKDPAQPLPTALPYECVAEADPYTGKPYAEADKITEDATYVIRAWMAVLDYLVTDYLFLHE